MDRLIQEEMHERIAIVRKRIGWAAERAKRDPAEVTLIAVSKTMSLAAVRFAYEEGVRHFGENRVQEAEAKFAEFHPADLTLHMVGHLQRNKAAKALAVFDTIQSVDSEALALALSRRLGEGGAPVPVLLEVNVAGEESKFGFAPEDVPAALERIAQLPGLDVQGLMTIAPYVLDAEEVRPVFRQLRELREECRQRLGLPLPHLSMGMTNDFAVAIEEGATMVRVGRAIFGERA
jgi:pyridoxal phosphate enzyme (YggS family)